MATPKKNLHLYEQFMAAKTEEEKFSVCANFCLQHVDARERAGDVDGLNYRLDKILDGIGLRQTVCEDARQPEIYWRFVAKVCEAIPEWTEEQGLTEWVANLRKRV